MTIIDPTIFLDALKSGLYSFSLIVSIVIIFASWMTRR